MKYNIYVDVIISLQQPTQLHRELAHQRSKTVCRHEHSRVGRVVVAPSPPLNQISRSCELSVFRVTVVAVNALVAVVSYASASTPEQEVVTV